MNQFYWPDVAATAQLLTDLAEALARRGHEVHVVCSRGGYGGESVRLPREEIRNGVHIHRAAATGLGRKRILHRLCDYATFYASALQRSLVLPRADVCVALTTPPFVASIGALYKRVRRTPLVLWAMDLYPDIAAAMGVLRPLSVEHHVLRAVASWVYQQTDRVISLGYDMTERLRRTGVRSDRIATIPSWSPGEAVAPFPDSQTPFRARHGINGHFVVMYSGNMGVVHEFPTILSAAQRLKDRDDVLFVFVGGGAQKRPLVDEVRRAGLPNVRFCPYQPLDSLSESLGAADLHVISMKPNIEGMLVPSKLYGILAAGRPSMLIGPANNEVARTLRESRSGWVVRPGASDQVVELIETMRSQPEMGREMGARARQYYEACSTRERRTNEIMDAIEDAAGVVRNTRPAVRPTPRRMPIAEPCPAC